MVRNLVKVLKPDAYLLTWPNLIVCKESLKENFGCDFVKEGLLPLLVIFLLCFNSQFSYIGLTIFRIKYRKFDSGK